MQIFYPAKNLLKSQVDLRYLQLTRAKIVEKKRYGYFFSQLPTGSHKKEMKREEGRADPTLQNGSSIANDYYIHKISFSIK